MLSSPIQMTTMLTYASGFNPTTEVEPFFAGIHTVRLIFSFVNVKICSSFGFCHHSFACSPPTRPPLRTCSVLDIFVDTRPSPP